MGTQDFGSRHCSRCAAMMSPRALGPDATVWTCPECKQMELWSTDAA
jgi:hypothetical protein